MTVSFCVGRREVHFRRRLQESQVGHRSTQRFNEIRSQSIERCTARWTSFGYEHTGRWSDCLYDDGVDRSISLLLGCAIAGGGAFEIVAHQTLTQYKDQVKGRARLGVQSFADALLIIPKVIAQNAGYDQQETIVKLQHEYATSKLPVSIDIATGKSPSFKPDRSTVPLGEAMEPTSLGIFDNYRVKKQLLHSSTSIATNLILVDEILRAGLSSLRPGGQ